MKNFKNFIYESKTPRKIYLDMDGVICDFDKRFTELTDGENFKKYSDKYGWDKTWKTIEKFGIEFWSEMDWTEDGEKLWNFLKNLENVEILTGSPRGEVGEYAMKGKEIWIEKNIGDIKVNHIAGKFKYTYVKNEDILIDDRKDICNLWGKAGGIAINHKNTDDTIEELKKLI